jgi:hypothetical protein
MASPPGQPFLRAAAVQIAPARSTTPKSASAGLAKPTRTNVPKQTKTNVLEAALLRSSPQNTSLTGL